jgi:hypothetical protein
VCTASCEYCGQELSGTGAAADCGAAAAGTPSAPSTARIAAATVQVRPDLAVKPLRTFNETSSGGDGHIVRPTPDAALERG